VTLFFHRSVPVRTGRALEEIKTIQVHFTSFAALFGRMMFEAVDRRDSSFPNLVSSLRRKFSIPDCRAAYHKLFYIQTGPLRNINRSRRWLHIIYLTFCFFSVVSMIQRNGIRALHS